MVNHVLKPCKVGIARWRHSVLPPHIVRQLVRAPVREIERRVCHDEIRAQGRVAVIEEGIGVEFAKVSVNTANGKVHLRHLPCGRVGILPVDRNVVDISAVALDKFCRLHKHSAAPAAWIIHPSMIGLQNFYQCANHAGRRVEFARQLALLLGKFGKAVFIGSAENVLLVPVLDHADVGEKIDHLAEAPLVKFRASKVFRQNVLQALVILLNRAHGFVNRRADFRCVCLCGNVTPPRALRHKENPLGGVLVDILLKAVAFRDQFPVLFLEAVGDVF